jgi:glycosyltransferase involved in cell wall biosynthesis
MKILIITNNLDVSSGWGRYSLSLIEQILENGIEVVVLCHKKNDKYSHIKQIEILPNPLSFKKTYLGAFFYAIKFVKHNKELRPFDKVHCFVEPYAFFAYIISRFLRVKYFITIHGSFGVKPFTNALYKFIQLFSYKNAERIICVSNYTKQRILKYRELQNITVIPNGVNKEAFCNIYILKKKENIIIGVGALKKRKGFDITIRAVKNIKEQIPDIQYYIIGSQKDIDYTLYLKELVNKLGLDKNIFFYECISDEKLKEFYKKAKVFVLTPVSNKYNFEGFGLVYLEANACGLPVVGSYDNGGEEAIRDGHNGFLAKANNPENIAEKIIKLLSYPELYEKMSRNAIDWSQDMLWGGSIVRKYLDVYGYKK